jgi:hypothetical protein
MLLNVLLLEGQGRVHEAWRATATAKYSRMKVERYKHGLHSGLTNDGPQVRFDLGNHASTFQICPLHTRQHPLQCLKICGDIYSSHVMLAWSSEDDHLRPRFAICHTFLGATAHVPLDSFDH